MCICMYHVHKVNCYLFSSSYFFIDYVVYFLSFYSHHKFKTTVKHAKKEQIQFNSTRNPAELSLLESSTATASISINASYN